MQQVIYELKELENRSKEHALGFSDWISKRLDETAATMVNSSMSDNDYMKLNELYYRKYRHERSRNSNDPRLDKAMRFCVLRIQQLAEYKKTPRHQSMFPLLTFSKKLDEDTTDFLKPKRNLYIVAQNNFKKKVMEIALLIAIILMVLLVFVYHFHFISGWLISIVIGILMYVLTVYFGFDRLFELKMEKLSENLDKTHLSIDLNLKNEKICEKTNNMNKNDL